MASKLNLGKFILKKNDGQDTDGKWATVLSEKVFHLNKRACNFHNEGGKFTCRGYKIVNHPHSKQPIIIKTSTLSNTAKQKEHKKLVNLLGTASKRQTKFFLLGQISKKNPVNEVPLTKFTKTEEFGGQPAGGKKVNKGIEFEKKMQARLVECIGGRSCKGEYAEEVKGLIDWVSDKTNRSIYESKPEGEANTSRPLEGSSSSTLHIAPGRPAAHGPKLTDITLLTGANGSGKKVYLSLKFGSTLTFCNAGVQTIFKPDQMANYKIKEKQGVALLKLFGINNEKFCKVWSKKKKDVVSVEQENVTKKINTSNLKNFLSTAIGAGYWMVHGHEPLGNGGVDAWIMDTAKNTAAATITGSVIVHYGGKRSAGRRIDVVFSNNYFDFSLNIRNKQSGWYPSHVMLDYKSKATGLKKQDLSTYDIA